MSDRVKELEAEIARLKEIQGKLVNILNAVNRFFGKYFKNKHSDETWALHRRIGKSLSIIKEEDK
jgi:hypothetical protein